MASDTASNMPMRGSSLIQIFRGGDSDDLSSGNHSLNLQATSCFVVAPYAEKHSRVRKRTGAALRTPSSSWAGTSPRSSSSKMLRRKDRDGDRESVAILPPYRHRAQAPRPLTGNMERKYRRQPVVLALAPVVQGVGYTVFEGPLTLVDWGVRYARTEKNRRGVEGANMCVPIGCVFLCVQGYGFHTLTVLCRLN